MGGEGRNITVGQVDLYKATENLDISFIIIISVGSYAYFFTRFLIGTSRERVRYFS